MFGLPPYDKVVGDVNKWVFTAGVKHFMPEPKLYYQLIN